MRYTDEQRVMKISDHDEKLTQYVNDHHIAETEIKNGRFDYTKWREDKFEDMTLEELNEAAAEFERKHPFTGNAKRI